MSGPPLPERWSDRAPRCRKPVFRQLWHRCGRLWHDILTQRDAPHRIAIGIAIGFFVGWLPVVGLQMLLCLLLCWLVRANFFATLPGVWMSNPLTMVPMYWLENRVGALFAGQAITIEAMRRIWDQIGEIMANEGFWTGTWEGTQLLFTEFLDATVAMLIGGGILGLINAALVYYPALRLVQRYHERRRGKMQVWSERHRRHEPPPEVPEPGPEGDVHPAEKEAV